MVERTDGPEVVIWTDAGRAELTASLLDAMGQAVRPIGVGGPRVGEVDDLARRLDCPCHDDLRKLVVDRPASFVLLASMQQVGVAEVLAAAGQGSLLLTFDPPAADLNELSALNPRNASRGTIAPRRMVLLPAFDQTPGFLGAADPQEVLGEQRLAAFESVGPPKTWSLFTRLYDGWQTVLNFTPLPESVTASLVGPLREVQDDLRQLSGPIAAHARMPDGSSAVLHLTDQAGQERRCLHVLGVGAELRMTDTGYDLQQFESAAVDRDEAAPGGITFVELAARQWRRLIDRLDSPISAMPPHRSAEALACCMACLLSARTGQSESPRKLIELGSP